MQDAYVKQGAGKSKNNVKCNISAKLVYRLKKLYVVKISLTATTYCGRIITQTAKAVNTPVVDLNMYKALTTIVRALCHVYVAFKYS